MLVAGLLAVSCTADFCVSTRLDWLSVSSLVHPFVGYQTCEHKILEMGEPVLMQIGTSAPQGKGKKRLILGVRRSKFKVT